MNRLPFLSVVLILLFSVPSLHAGVTVPFDQVFAFSSYPNEKTSIVNHFLLKIAEANNKLRAYTSYHFVGELEAVASRSEDGKCMVNIRLLSHALSGDIQYKAFSLEKVLIPDRMSFVLGILDDTGTLVFEKTYRDAELGVQGVYAVIPEYQHWCVPKRFDLRLTAVEFYYSKDIYDRMGLWLEAMENYYHANDLLSEVPEMIKACTFEDPEELILNEFTLCEAEHKLADARYILFSQWLDLGNGDPELFLPRYALLSAVVDSLRAGFNRNLSQIDDLLYERALEYGVNEEHPKAREIAALALVYNPVHIPSQLLLGHYEQVEGRYGDAILRLAEVIARMYPSGIWMHQSQQLAGSLTEDIFGQVAELIADNRFLDALKQLDVVEQFCQLLLGRYECPVRLKELQTISHQGMFQSFLLVTERAFRNDNLSYCLEYLKNAMEYQHTHPDFFTNSHQIEQWLQKLVDRHRSLGDALYASGDIMSASHHYLAAKEICLEYHFLHCQP